MRSRYCLTTERDAQPEGRGSAGCLLSAGRELSLPIPRYSLCARFPANSRGISEPGTVTPFHMHHISTYRRRYEREGDVYQYMGA